MSPEAEPLCCPCSGMAGVLSVSVLEVSSWPRRACVFAAPNLYTLHNVRSRSWRCWRVTIRTPSMKEVSAVRCPHAGVLTWGVPPPISSSRSLSLRVWQPFMGAYGSMEVTERPCAQEAVQSSDRKKFAGHISIGDCESRCTRRVRYFQPSSSHALPFLGQRSSPGPTAVVHNTGPKERQAHSVERDARVQSDSGHPD